MICYNNWCNISETMDDNYDTFNEIIMPSISNILDDKFYDEEVYYIKKNIDNYCIDEYLNMEFKEICKECFLHEPHCVCV
jgi:hypothetical protein